MASDAHVGEISREQDLKRTIVVLNKHQTFVLTTHREPDGDGLGSEAGLYEALRQLDKQVWIVNNDPLPKQYQFLPHREAFETYEPSEHDALIGEADVVAILDAAHADRTGRMDPVLTGHKGLTLVIDHHQVSGWAAMDLIDSRAAATAEIVQDLIEALSVELTPTMAGALYVGMTTDTQNFTTSSTSAATYRRASRLIQAGADPALTQEHLSATWELGRLRMLGDFLSGIQTAAEGQVAWGVVTQENMKTHGADRSGLEGFVDQMLRLASAKAAVMFVEEPDGAYRLSMRSRPGLRVDGLAETLGGGGHRLAAGARVPAAQGLAMMEVLQRSEG